MNRRTFLQSTALAAPMILRARPSKQERLRRVGMNTILFRMRFPVTHVEGTPVLPKLTLFEVPEYYADRFKLHNLEFWDAHFESYSPGYLADLKKAIAKTHSRLIDIQLDYQPTGGWFEGRPSGYFLASRDDKIRHDSLEFVKGRIDCAAAVGSQAIRVNTENGDFNLCVQSFRDITIYAATRSVIILVENHGGISADPDLHVRLIREVNHKNIRTAPDFGNHKPEVRYEALQKIMPYAWEVQPKAVPFNDKFEFTGYDFARCMRIAVDSGFQGVYSVDYWDHDHKPVDYEKIADWLIEQTLEYM